MMKAAVYRSYGPPEVVKIEEITKPTPAQDEFIVKVHASTVNRTDAGFRSAVYFVSRFFSGLFYPKIKVLGSDYAGMVVETGKNVTNVQIGDRIFGYNDERFGGHAEYIRIKSTDAFTLIPESLSYQQAAALPEGGHYALGNIRASGIKSGESAMVYGATGAIGSAAVQLLKHEGVKVTAVCPGEHVELVRSLGADEVIDYKAQDYKLLKDRYRFIFDAVGKINFGQCKHLLTDDGVYISTELGPSGENIWKAILKSKSKGKRILFPIPQTKKEDIEFLAQLAKEGHFKPVIDRSYPLAEIVEAYRYIETGQKVGNVILEMP